MQVNDARILGDLPADRFMSMLAGNRLEASRRHGKHLLVRLARGGWLTLHFGMTGGLDWFEDLADDPPYDRVRLDFADGGHLAYVNRRMLGRVGLAEDADAFIAAEELGPDALDPGLDEAAFGAALAGRRRDLKSVLMDQALIAGVGNIYADEILFQARLHPQTAVDALSENRRGDLFRALKGVLATAVERGAGAEQLLDAAAGRFPAAGAPQGRPLPALRPRDRDPQVVRPHELLLPALPTGARPLTQAAARSGPARVCGHAAGAAESGTSPQRRKGRVDQARTRRSRLGRHLCALCASAVKDHDDPIRRTTGTAKAPRPAPRSAPRATIRALPILAYFPIKC